MTTNDISASTSRRRRAALCLALGAACLAVARPSPAQQATTLHPNIGWSPAPAQAPASSAVQPVQATSPFHFPADLLEQMKRINDSADLTQKGDRETAQGDWLQAMNDYQQALSLWPYEQEALYGVADDSLKRGDMAGAVGYYRRAIYTHPDPPVLPLFHENNVFRLMEYALLLSQTGQQAEALAVYRHGAALFNVMDGRPRHKVALPDFGDGPGQSPFSPQALQAMAHVRWAEDHSDFDAKGAAAHLQRAVALAPDSPVVYYYRARYEARHVHDYKAVKADFDQAAQLGGPEVGDAVQQEEHFFRHEIAAATQTKLSQ